MKKFLINFFINDQRKQAGIHNMYKINFQEPIHIHFIGIGGISMSGLAEILFEEHFTISGSDSKESELTRHLEHMGMQIFMVRKLPIL